MYTRGRASSSEQASVAIVPDVFSSTDTIVSRNGQVWIKHREMYITRPVSLSETLGGEIKNNIIIFTAPP